MRQLGLLPSTTANAMVGRSAGRVADEPAVADVAAVGLGRQRAGLARDLDGQQAPAALVAERPLGRADARRQLHHPPDLARGGRVDDRGAGPRPAARSAARRGRRRDRSASARASRRGWRWRAASSAPCMGDSVECQKPAAVRANSRRVGRDVEVRRLDRQVERDRLVEAEAAARPGPARRRSGGGVASLAMIAFWDLPRPNASVSQRRSSAGRSIRLSGRIDDTPPW